MRYVPPKPRFIRLVARTVHGAPVYTAGRVVKPSPVLVARIIRRTVH